MRRLRQSLISVLVLLAVVLAQLPATARPVAAAGRDYPIANGHFFTQATNTDDRGYAVIDDNQARFWAEFQRLGGVPGVGYPISQRFTWNGFTVQAFQKLVLQWRPEVNQAWAVNLLDLLSQAGRDSFLQSVRQTPPPKVWDDAGRPWEEVIRRHQAVLDAYPAIRAKYRAAPGDPLDLYGLPTSDVVDMGNNFAVRAQRVVFQQWKVAVPWAAAGEVTVANGGDLAKEAGLLSGAALVPVAAPAGATEAPPSPPAAPATTRLASGRPASGRELAQIQTIQQRISQVRGLPFLADIDKRLLTREEIRAWFARAVGQSTDSDDHARAGRQLWLLLGLIPESLDLNQTYGDLYGSQIIGLYLPEEKRLYVLDEGTGSIGPVTDLTVAHELVHVLEDQHFDLGQYLREANDTTSDESLARRAVVEGDAILASSLYARQFFTRSQIEQATSGGDSDLTTLSRTPLILQELLYFPYLSGTSWAQALVSRGGWDLINGAYRRPPRSTAEILHPNRYLTGIEPNRPDLPDIAPAIGPDWGEIERDSLGELIWRTAIRQYLGLDAATAAADGLAGDTVVLLENTDRQALLAGRLEFDTPADATDFFNAYNRVNQARFGNAAVERIAGRVVYGADPAVLLEQRGSAVIIVLAPTTTEAYAATGALP